MISIVVPVYNEEESLLAFYKELNDQLVKLHEKYEVIFVDDGSNDSSLDLLKNLEQKDNNVKVFSFRKNQGKAEALTMGFQKATGDYVVTLDADLQDKPSEIHKLLDKTKENWEVICGWRKDRKDSIHKRISSKLFNSLTSTFWGLELHDYNCGLKVYTKEAAKSLRLYGGLHRFIPLLVYQEGFSVTELPVVHQQRKFGESKYGFSKIWKDLPDIFTMLFLAKYSKRPLHFFGTVGSLVIFAGLGILVYLTILHFQGEAIGRRPLLIFGVLFVVAGFQIFFTGFLAELILSIHQKSELHFPLKYSSEEESKYTTT